MSFSDNVDTAVKKKEEIITNIPGKRDRRNTAWQT